MARRITLAAQLRLVATTGGFVGKDKRIVSGFSATQATPIPRTQRQKSQTDNSHEHQERKAADLIKQGKLQEAETIYRSLLSSSKANHVTFGNLAAICGMQGKWQELIHLLRAALEHWPNYAEGHYNLGIAFKKQGLIDQAIASYKKALEIKPNYPQVHNNLGNLYKSIGSLNSAIASYKKAIELSPGEPEAHNNLGVALKEVGNFSEAISAHKAALTLAPNDPETHYNLGNAFAAHGCIHESIYSFRTAIQLRPNFPEAHNNLGLALQETNSLQAAISSFQQALKLRPDYQQAHNNIGSIYKKLGDLNAAIISYKKAISIHPNDPEAHYNLGIVLMDQGDVERAISCYGEALRLKPIHSEAHKNLGNAYQEQGDLKAAIASYTAAVKLKPEDPGAQVNLSMAELLLGNYSSGWEGYDQRFHCEQNKNILSAKPLAPLWKGTKINVNDKLLLVGEQGIGDTLQFMRYVLPLREQGIQISLCTHAKLHSLIQKAGIAAETLTPEQGNAVVSGQWMPLLSVPRLLGVSPDNPIITKPYIKTTTELSRKWQKILAPQLRPIIGINWQGNPEQEKNNSRGRSIPLETFLPVVQQTKASLLSLQKGFGSDQIDNCSFKELFVSCQPLVDETWDFLEAAAIIKNCDLVITSDTAVAHLAGGMGMRTWLLLKKVPEWRWGLEGDTSFWYPSMRLFRQRERGNWDEVLQRVAEALKEEFSGEGMA